MPKRAVENPSGKRVPLNMKTTSAIRARIEEAAAASGRSLTQEVEWRIERSFDFEDIRSAVEHSVQIVLKREGEAEG